MKTFQNYVVAWKPKNSTIKCNETSLLLVKVVKDKSHDTHSIIVSIEVPVMKTQAKEWIFRCINLTTGSVYI